MLGREQYTGGSPSSEGGNRPASRSSGKETPAQAESLVGSNIERRKFFSPHTVSIVTIDSSKRQVEPMELYLRLLRDRYGLTQQQFAEQEGINSHSYGTLEKGNTVRLGSDVAEKIVSAVNTIADPNDPDAEKVNSIVTLMSQVRKGTEARDRLEEIREQFPFHGIVHFKEDGEVLDLRSEDQKWYTTIRKVSVREAVRLLRVSDDLNQSEFAEEVGFSLNHVNYIENGQRTPNIFFINKVLDASMLASEGRAAQLLRLKAQNQVVMSLDELKNASLGTLVEYLRNVQGLTRQEVANKIFSSREVIRRIERHNYIPSRFEDDLTQWLNPSDTLRKVIRQKIEAPTMPVADDVLSGMKNDQFLFEDTTEPKDADSIVSTSERLLLNEFAEKDSVGDILHLIRLKKELTQSQVADIFGGRDYSESYISALERGERLPRDHTVAFLFRSFGYDIHHQLSQYVLKRLDEERKARRSQPTLERSGEFEITRTTASEVSPSGEKASQREGTSDDLEEVPATVEKFPSISRVIKQVERELYTTSSVEQNVPLAETTAVTDRDTSQDDVLEFGAGTVHTTDPELPEDREEAVAKSTSGVVFDNGDDSINLDEAQELQSDPEIYPEREL